jgi:hypothetical protein
MYIYSYSEKVSNTSTHHNSARSNDSYTHPHLHAMLDQYMIVLFRSLY